MFRRKQIHTPDGDNVVFRPIEKMFVAGSYELPVATRDEINAAHNKAKDALQRLDFHADRISALENTEPPPADRLDALEKDFERLVYKLRMERGIQFERSK